MLERYRGREVYLSAGPRAATASAVIFLAFSPFLPLRVESRTDFLKDDGTGAYSAAHCTRENIGEEREIEGV